MKLSRRSIVLGSLGLTVLAIGAYVYATGFGSSFYFTAPTKALPAPAADLPSPAPQAGGERELVVAGGCFWCTEAVFEQLAGVKEVISGYSGGAAADADYDSVSAGVTDHAESVKIVYDSELISYGQLLNVFFATAHDPTQKDRQGPDVGRQYRSAIFYATEEEKQMAAAYIAQLDAEGVYPQPIVTTLEPLREFYRAEEYHQDYATKHPLNFYVRRWSLPKVRKTHEHFPDLVSAKE